MKCDILREEKHRMTESIVSASPRIESHYSERRRLYAEMNT